MYRFLDKRFYNNDCVAMDLIEFACGHVGLTESGNVAILKRRLAPAIAELEEIGFLARLAPEERFQKVKAGVWRVQFRRAGGAGNRGQGPGTEEARAAEAPTAGCCCSLFPVPCLFRGAGRGVLPPVGRDHAGDAGAARPGAGRGAARAHGSEAKAVIACLVRVTKKRWPDCRSLSGAVQKYLPDAVRLHQLERRREAAREAAEAERRQELEAGRTREQAERRLQEAWAALPAEERDAIRRGVREKLDGATAPEAFVQRLCLEELARR